MWHPHAASAEAVTMAEPNRYDAFKAGGIIRA
jgi:hypothetical protein